ALPFSRSAAFQTVAMPPSPIRSSSKKRSSRVRPGATSGWSMRPCACYGAIADQDCIKKSPKLVKSGYPTRHVSASSSPPLGAIRGGGSVVRFVCALLALAVVVAGCGGTAYDSGGNSNRPACNTGDDCRSLADAGCSNGDGGCTTAPRVTVAESCTLDVLYRR